MKRPCIAHVSLLIIVLFIGNAMLGGQSAEEQTRQVSDADNYIAREFASMRIPGMSVCIVSHGRVLLARGYGSANLELSVPATEHTIYELASMTKPFTATAVMMLVEEGRITLQDSITKYFSMAPSTWQHITVGQLLSHTSGLGDYFSIPEFRSNSDFQWSREYDRKELLPLFFHVPVLSAPGEKYSYSNVGYYLLGFILEKVSGESYERFLQERIFKPLRMVETRRMSRADRIAGRASGYTWKNGVLKNARYTSITWAYSEGGLVSSVADLAKATAGLFDDKLLKEATLDSMWRPYRLNNGTFSGYGIGWLIGSDPKQRQIFHDGNKPGFASIIRHYPDDKLTVVVLANVNNQPSGEANVDAVSHNIADFFLHSALSH